MTPSRVAARVALAVGLVLLALGAGRAVADGLDARGWTSGVVAAGSARVLGAPAKEVKLQLPIAVVPHLDRPVMLVYFSPHCPHCQAAQPELSALYERVKGRIDIVGVASNSVETADVAAYAKAFAVPYPLVHDTDGEVQAAMGVRSTPSALLVQPIKKKGKVVEGKVLDVWYPYLRDFDALVEMRVATLAGTDPWAAFRPGEYQGVAACAACHVQEADAWHTTHHSVAWYTLASRGKETDPTCTGCHVTGNGAPTGWNGEAESTRVDVGCEACHGPGGPHDGARADAREACVGCHDAKHSIAFSVEKGLPGIDHFRATGKDDAWFRAARDALYDGTAPRSLLAFPAGDTVGAKACATCHPAETAQWSGSPHGRAMARLDAKEKVDPGCVRCHATGAATPVAADAPITAWRSDESVGCEACHGPGDAHVKAGGAKGTIEGLGDDCPVCVIEAVCTSCHTKKWDPDWDLDVALPKVGHGR